MFSCFPLRRYSSCVSWNTSSNHATLIINTCKNICIVIKESTQNVTTKKQVPTTWNAWIHIGLQKGTMNKYYLTKLEAVVEGWFQRWQTSHNCHSIPNFFSSTRPRSTAELEMRKDQSGFLKNYIKLPLSSWQSN